MPARRPTPAPYDRPVIAADAQPPEPLPGARLLFSLSPGVAHLNHGAAGAVPIGVQRAQQRLRDEMEGNPPRFFARGFGDRVAHARRHLAGFLGADPDGAALVPNVSTGVATVLATLRLAPGDEIARTDHGHRGVALAVEREARRYGVVTRTAAVPLAADDATVVAACTAALTPRTRLMIVDQVTMRTVRAFPVARVAAAARAQGVAVLVDGAHAPGMLPVDVGASGADFWVGNFHKWAYAPRGTALLCVAPPWRDRVEPLVVSAAYEAGFPASLEWQATQDYTAWLAAPTGIYTLRSLGVDRVRRHNAALAAYGQRVVGEALAVPAADLPHPGDDAVSMRIVPLPPGVAASPADATELGRRIADEVAAEVAVGAWGARGYLRLSAQVYNTAGEYERLAGALPALLP
ncbi:MAG TPA: aminotransferase class V-fold PLP-dependent enzyme [Pilimelia sp.]|nr:aminotransferase class V-fold PLP-dependent enzyme [Pilimelia sp.]